MNGWIESGSDLCAKTFKYVKDTDVVIRSDDTYDAVVLCNGESGNSAAMYVSQNNVGIGVRPRQFANLDVCGTIFCDTKIELCSNSATNPITYPRFVMEPSILYFSNKPNNMPTVIDGAKGLMLTNDTIVRNTMGVLSDFFSIPLKAVNTSDIATDIEIDRMLYHEKLYLDMHLCIEQSVTKIVQCTSIDNDIYRLTLVPPLPKYVTSNTSVKASIVNKPVTYDVNKYNNKSYTSIHIISITFIDDYSCDIMCNGITNDILRLVNEYIAISSSEQHNYQQIVQVRSVKLIDNIIVINVASPSLKNKLDLSGYNSIMYLYNIDAPIDFLWQTDYSVHISFVVDSAKSGYYLRIEDTILVNMLSNDQQLEDINAIDKIIISHPEAYSFNISKTYIQDNKALLYINEQSSVSTIPTMFTGIYDIKYKITGMPLLFKDIMQIDEYTVFIKCEGVQGYSFGDAMTIISGQYSKYDYVLLNDIASHAWRIINVQIGKGITIRCSDKTIIENMMIDPILPRVVYIVPFIGRDKPKSWHDNIVLNHGNLVLKDADFMYPDTNISYKNNTLSLGDTVEIKKESVAIDTLVKSKDFVKTYEKDRYIKTSSDTKADLDYINSLELEVIPNEGIGIKNIRDINITDLLLKCVGAIQELNKK